MDESLQNRLNADRLQSRQIDELIGLARGLIADGAINEAEVLFLEKWLVSNLATAQQPLISGLYLRVSEILADGEVDQEECSDLFAALSSFAAGEFELGEAPKSTSLPLCNPPPGVSIPAKCFCFTGTFSFGQRKHCEQAVAERGGEFGSLNKKTDFLVIGAYATESWKHSSFGNKILKAIEMRNAGIPIAIISERHWTSSL
jgi:NAD-dependent DNA ligase